MKRVRKFLLPVLVICLFLSFIFLPSRIIKISKLECETQYGSCPEEVNSKLQTLNSKNLTLVKKEVKKAMKDYYYVSDYSTQLKLPNVLKVQLLVEKPIYAVKKEGTENFALVSAEGKVLGISDETSLPNIITDEPINNVGENVTVNDLFALKLMAGINSMYQVTTGKVNRDFMHVELPMGLSVIFPLGEGLDSDILLGSVRLIVGKIEAEGTGEYKEIDLRFRDPVLR